MTEPILPLDVAASERVDKIPCSICRRQFSKYTCPTCNIAYCSLTCFRSETHARCSESFYRKELESNVRTDTSRTAAERLNMMEILKRFGEGGNGSLFPEDEQVADEETDLEKRLGGINLESAPSDAIWLALTPEERSRFLRALDDPSSEVAQQLLASEELERITQDPWWDAPTIGDDVPASQYRRYGVTPDAMTIIPSTMVKPFSDGPSLIYNLCAICISYAYATRCLSTSPLSSPSPDGTDTAEARRFISQLSPFLLDHKAKTLHTSLSSVVTDLWSRFDPGKMHATFFAILLRDTAILLRPVQVSEVLSPSGNSTEGGSGNLSAPYLDSHPHRKGILVLSDLCKLFGRSTSNADDMGRLNHVTHKLVFYAGRLLSTPSPVLNALSQEVLVRSQVVRSEAEPYLDSLKSEANVQRHRATSQQSLVEEASDKYSS